MTDSLMTGLVILFLLLLTMYTYVERIQNVCPKNDANDSVLCTICFSISHFIFQLCFFWRRVARSLCDCIEQNMSALYSMLKFILKYEYIT